MKRALVLVLVVLGCAKHERVPEAWGVADYTKAGIDIVKPWGPDDYKTAAAVLTQQLPDHRDRLPHFHGDKSGAVFAKLVAPLPDDSTAPVSARFIAHLTRSEALNALSSAYMEDLLAPPPREYIEIMGANLSETAILASASEPFIASFGPDDPKHEVRIAGLAKMRMGYGKMMHGSLMIGGDARLPDDDRVAMVGYVTAVLHPLLPQVEPAMQQTIRETIATQVRATTGDVHEAFVAAQRAL